MFPHFKYTLFVALAVALPCCSGGGNSENISTVESSNTSAPIDCSQAKRCFYINSTTGNDSQIGSSAAPWRTYKNLLSIPTASTGAPNSTQLLAGDLIVFQAGTYGFNSTYLGEPRALFLENVHGDPANPIVISGEQGSTISPDSPAVGLHLLNCSNLIIQGLNINNAYQAGVWIEDSDNIHLTSSRISNTDGEDNNNIAGVYILNSTNVKIENSTLFDNFDRTNADTSGIKTDNSRNIVIFGGGNVSINNNHIYQSANIEAAKTGGCVTYKHSSLDSSLFFEVSNNVFENCFHTAIGTGTPNSWIHHNLILNSDPIAIRNFGGPTSQQDILVENNTIIGGSGLSFNPSTSHTPLGLITFRRNIVIDNGSYYKERGMLTLDTYGSDTQYRDTLLSNKFIVSDNCYWNEFRPPLWSIFAENGGDFGELGELLDFASWENLGFENGSSVIDAELRGEEYKAQNPACSDKGWKS